MSDAREDESDNEWSSLAQSYEAVLRPRFEPLYNCIANAVVKQIQADNRKHKFKVLDYGTGPGEPVLTILKTLEANEFFNVELRAFDSSKKMLSVAADRLKKLNTQHLTVQFTNLDDLSNSNMYDIITMSLVLPYASDKVQMLRDRSNQLQSEGLFISSHWSNPRLVPFLTVIKGVVGFMATGEQIDISQLESDGSFSCWREETTRQIFMAGGFTVEEYISVNLPMSFPNIRALLSFCEGCPWFDDQTVYYKAEEETKRILREDYGLQLDFNGSFQLPNTAVVVVASKSLQACSQLFLPLSFKKYHAPFKR